MIILFFTVEMFKTNSKDIFAITFGTTAGGVAIIMIITIFIVLMYFKRRKSSTCAAVELDNTTRYVMNLKVTKS